MQPAIMVMGVSGCGKTTIGAALANALGGVFLDGDDYHPQVNIARMAAGHPLTDELRWPWLDALAGAVLAQRQSQTTVFACSALRKIYRDHLREAIPQLQIVYLDAPRHIVMGRLDARADHFMPQSLLDSQFDALEVPQNVDAVISVDQPVASIVARLHGTFRRHL